MSRQKFLLEEAGLLGYLARDFLRFHQGVAGGFQRASNVNETNRRYSNTCKRREHHVESPFGHLPLGFEVFLGTPFFSISLGIGYAALALDTGSRGLSPLRAFVLLISGIICALSFIVPLYQLPPDKGHKGDSDQSKCNC